MAKRFSMTDLKQRGIFIEGNVGRKLTAIKPVSKSDLKKAEKEIGKAKKKAVNLVSLSKEKKFIEDALIATFGVSNVEREYKGIEGRKFRFDWAVPSKMIAFEYNGLFSAKSRHTTPTGYTADMEKINLAQINNWKIFQFTALNYKQITELLTHL